MSKRVRSEFVCVIGASVGVLLSACGGGKDVPLTDGGTADADTGTRDDGGTSSSWPVPSDFPADGPTQPGEGDACQLSVQCAGDRQICVDDACVREERVTSAGLVRGDWRVLTPAEVRTTTRLPLESVDGYVRTVLDERGEVAVVGNGVGATGAPGLFYAGARTRFLELMPGVTVGETILPMGDGFLSDDNLAVSYVGPAGAVEWTAAWDGGGATRPPLAGMITAGHTRSLIHTPTGPVMVAILRPGALGEWNVLEFQRLDSMNHEFVFMDFAAGPYLVDRSLGYAVMGPTGLELVVAEVTTADGFGRFFAHTVATGAERPLGSVPLPWDVDVRPVSADRWVAVALRDSLTSPCSSLAFTSESTEPVGRVRVFGSDVEGGHCEWLSDWEQLSQPASPVLFSPTPPPGLWIAYDALGLLEAAPDGTVSASLDVPARGYNTVASRFGKTFEVFSAEGSTGADPGLLILERSLLRAGGI